MSLFFEVELPPELVSSGLYNYLLPGIAHDKLLADYIPPARMEEVTADLWAICPLPASLPYFASSIAIIRWWLEILVAQKGEVNTLLESRVNRLFSVLESLLQIASDTNVKSPLIDTETPLDRRQFYTYLTQYPVYSTLMLIEANEEPEQKLNWLLVLARMTEANSELKYEACLRFDRLRTKLQQGPFPFSLSTIREATLTELKMRFAQHNEFSVLCSFLTPLSRKKTFTSSPFRSDNMHRQRIVLAEGYEVTFVTPTDAEGNVKQQHLEIELPKSEVEYTVLGEGMITTSPELTYEQRVRKFKAQNSGRDQAIRRANLNLPMSNSALTPAEMASWIRFHCPEILTGEIYSIPLHERRYWFLFFLKLLGVFSLDLFVYNRNAKSGTQNKVPCISYELDRSGHCDASIILPARIFKGKQPQYAGEQYYSVQSQIEISPPWPIQSLLNAILREETMTASKRHDQTLGKVLSISPEKFEKWLSKKLATAKPRFAFKVTKANLSNSFFHYSAQSMPVVLQNYLQSSGSTQAHYINVATALVETVMHTQWGAYLSSMQFPTALGWDGEKAQSHRPDSSFHDQIGSAITVREELIGEAFRVLLEPVNAEAFITDPPSRIEMIECVVTYLHMRISIELANRPLNKVYPTEMDCAFGHNVCAVRDKRSHHKEELRLLVLSEELISLIKHFRDWANTASASFHRLGMPILAIYDGRTWQPLTLKRVENLLDKYLGNLEPGAFRHLAARNAFMETSLPDSEFDQTQLNVLMNHFYRGQSPLSRYSLVSIESMVNIQQRLLSRQKEGKSGFGVYQMWLEIEKWDNRVCSLLADWIDSGVKLDG